MEQNQPYVVYFRPSFECSNREEVPSGLGEHPAVSWIIKRCESQGMAGRGFVIEQKAGSPLFRVPEIRNLLRLKGTRIITLYPGKGCHGEKAEPIHGADGVTFLLNLPEVAPFSVKSREGVRTTGVVVSRETGTTSWAQEWLTATVKKSRQLNEESGELLENERAFLNAWTLGLGCSRAEAHGAVERPCPACNGAHRKHTNEPGCQKYVEPVSINVKENVCQGPPGRRAPVIGWKRDKPVKEDVNAVPAGQETKILDENVKPPNQEMPPSWRTAIRHLHHMFGHPSNETLARVFQRGKAPLKMVQAVLGWECLDCDIRSKPKAARVATVPRASQPNEGVAIDAMYITDHRTALDSGRPRVEKWAIYNFVCVASTYHQCGLGENDAKSRVNQEQFEREWVHHYGAPCWVQTDGGPENVGQEFTTYLKGLGVEHHVVAAEAAWKNGLVERHGGILKDMILKTLESSPTLSVRAVLDHCVRAKNELARVSGHAPVEYFCGRMPRGPLESLGLQEIPLPTLSLLDSDTDMYEKMIGVQQKARDAFEEIRSRRSISEALRHRSRPTRGPYSIGSQVYYWRRHKSGERLGVGGTKAGSWHGKATMVASQGGTYWLSHSGKVIKAAAEHLRAVAPGEEIPWEDVEKFLTTLERRLGDAQEIVFEEAGPGEAHDDIVIHRSRG